MIIIIDENIDNNNDDSNDCNTISIMYEFAIVLMIIMILTRRN